MSAAVTLSGLFIYPVKGCRGLSVARAEVDDPGLAGDRRFMIVDGMGMFLTQRTQPRMALIETSLTPNALTLSAPGHDSFRLPLPFEPPDLDSRFPVTVWRDVVMADDCGRAASDWLSRFLGLRCRLVHLGAAFSRPMPVRKLPAALGSGEHHVSFADAHPFLLISEASLENLNTRLDEPLPMNRFRPNLVIQGCDAFAEDAWARLRIGPVTFHTSGPCARCVVTTTNQLTAERGKEPLRTLALYRRDPASPTEVIFGQNLVHETKHGTLRLGDVVAEI